MRGDCEDEGEEEEGEKLRETWGKYEREWSIIVQVFGLACEGKRNGGEEGQKIMGRQRMQVVWEQLEEGERGNVGAWEGRGADAEGNIWPRLARWLINFRS